MDLSLIPLLEDCDDLTTLVTLHDFEKEKIPQSAPFKLDSHNDAFCILHFRFAKADIYRLKRCLRIPPYLRLKNEMDIEGTEALCILLKRLAYPNRLVDLMKFFGRIRSVLSMTINGIVEYLMENHGLLLNDANHPFITQDELKFYADCIHHKGAPYKMCFGFLDGTVRPICRPGINQREFYNGHKRTHALKFQSLMLPNGIIATMHGPVSGRRHDAHILAESGLLGQLHNFIDADGNHFYMYGDPAYPLRQNLMTPFKGNNLTRPQQEMNRRMSSVRESVEWGFAKIIQLFAFLDYKKNLKIGLSPVANYFLLGTIISNCHTCLYGSQVSDYFGCDPPSLEQYLRFV